CTPDPLYLHSFPTRRSSDLHALDLICSFQKTKKRTYTRGGGIKTGSFCLERQKLFVFHRINHCICCLLFPVVYNASCILQGTTRSEEHTSELQSRENLVCRL